MGSIIYSVTTKRIYTRQFYLNNWLLIETEYNGPLWYLSYLFIWYLIFYVVYKFITRVIRNNKIINAIWVIIGLIMMYLTPETYGLANTYCLAFVCGIYYAQLPKKEINKLKPVYLIISIIVIIIVILVHLNIDRNDVTIFNKRINFYVLILITNILYFIVLNAIVYIVNHFRLSLLKRIGKVSYYVYILHTPLIVNMIVLFDKVNPYIVLVLGMVIMVLVILIIIRINEKLKTIGYNSKV